MDINALMKQAQKMQEDLQETEKELKAKVYKTTVGGGAVEVQLNGAFQVDKIAIDKDMLEADNQEVIEELIQLAMNEVLGQATADKEESMAALTSGVNVPGMF